MVSSSGPEIGGTRRLWVVPIPEAALPELRRRMLGLTFVERRLREAKKLGIEHVYFLAPPELSRRELPRMNPDFCAPFSVIASRDAIAAGHGDQVYEVELLAVIDPKAPYEAVLRIESADDWRRAAAWHKRRIVTDSSAGWVARRINKPISLAVSSRLAATPLRPNHLTLFNLLIGLASALVVARPGYGHLVLGAALFQAASVLDGVDGELAKFRLESSRFGAWLDTFVDNTSLFAFLIGCAVHLARSGALETSALIGWAGTAIGATLLYLALQLRFVVTQLGEASLAVWMKKFVRKLPRQDPVVRLVELGDRVMLKDFISFFFLLVALTGSLEVLLYIGAPGMVLATFATCYLNTRYRAVARAHGEPVEASDSASAGGPDSGSSARESSPRRWSSRRAIG